MATLERRVQVVVVTPGRPRRVIFDSSPGGHASPETGAFLQVVSGVGAITSQESFGADLLLLGRLPAFQPDAFQRADDAYGSGYYGRDLYGGA